MAYEGAERHTWDGPAFWATIVFAGGAIALALTRTPQDSEYLILGLGAGGMDGGRRGSKKCHPGLAPASCRRHRLGRRRRIDDGFSRRLYE